MILCRLGFHRYVSVMLITLHDPFGNAFVFGIGRCLRCGKVEWRMVPPVSPGDAVNWALTFEGLAKRDFQD